MKIKSASINYAKRTVTVHYASGAIRTYRGRIPFSVWDYLSEQAYNEGVKDGIEICACETSGEVF